MRPHTHYWDAIVGDNWPAVEPAQWGTLETTLREATSDIDVDGLEYARRDFEDRVRVSSALQPAKDEMLARQSDSRALADAVVAVADLLRDFADLSHRTRNRILDIVDDATDAIAGLEENSRSDRPRIAQVHDIVDLARKEVSAAAVGAVHTIDPSWDKVHAELTALPVPQHPPGIGSADPGWLDGAVTVDAQGGVGPGADDYLVWAAAHGVASDSGAVTDPGVREVATAVDDPGPMSMPMVFVPQGTMTGTAISEAGATRAGVVEAEAYPYARSVDRVTADRAGTAELPGESADSGAGERGTTVERGRDYRPGDGFGPGETGGPGSAALLRSVVGSAMASEAGPAFEVGGNRVDGHLVLARTILGGILAAVESAWYGIGFAVAVLRRPGGGVTAFVTSNEGRGWLPSGLYLPREISTPWRWVGSNYSGWEEISDPARILAEFTVERRSRSDARLAALVSSEPIDTGMRRQLGETALEGRVAASAAMPLGTPGPGLVDRLGLVISPRNQTRLDSIPAVTIAPRCTDLAWDAHERVARLGAGTAATLGAPALRQRVLDALRHGREVQAAWWEELRDIDDLLAATILTQRTDVSRIPLGELRSGQFGAETSILRAMVAQRRGNELVLLLAGVPDRRMLRDAVYVHGQLAAHLDAAARRATTIPTGGEKTQ